jgi:hypothetical protein
LRFRLLGLEERWLLREAHAALVAECMRNAGFEDYVFVPRPYPRDRPASPTEGVELRIAQPDQKTFGLYEASLLPDEQPSNEYFERLSPAAQERFADAMFGSGSVETVQVGEGAITRPQNGCRTEAEEDLYRSPDYFELESRRSAFIGEIGSTLLAREDVRELLREYGECMASKGLTAGAPWDAWELGASRLEESTSDVVAYEHTVAAADRDCQQVVDYAARVLEAYGEIVRAAADANQELARLLEIENAALAHARDVL